MKKGFTLIELLLSLSITAVILLVISIFLAAILQSRVRNQAIGEVEEQGRAAMQLMTQTVRSATAITVPTVGATTTSLSVNTTISTTTPTVFSLAGGAIQMKEGAFALVPLTNSRVTVSGLTFDNRSRPGTHGTVQIQFTINSVNTSGRNEFSYQKTFFGSATIR